MLAIEYLKGIPRQWIPRHPSNSELQRWLKNKSIVINGIRPEPLDRVLPPIRQLIFFTGEKRVTVLDDGRYKMSWAKRRKKLDSRQPE